MELKLRELNVEIMRSMATVILVLRQCGNHDAADELTRARDTWARTLVSRADVTVAKSLEEHWVGE